MKILLCARMAEIVRDQLLQLGVVDVDNLEQQIQVEHTSLNRVVLSALPRGKKFKPLVSEYGQYHTVVHAPHVENPTDVVPAGAKLVHQRLAQRGEVRVDEQIFHSSTDGMSGQEEVMVSQYGVPRAPLDFCERAVSVAIREVWLFIHHSWRRRSLNKT